MYTNNQINTISKFIREHLNELHKEKFCFDKYDSRIVKGSWCYDKDFADSYQISHPITYELTHKTEFIPYMIWYRSRKQIEKYI